MTGYPAFLQPSKTDKKGNKIIKMKKCCSLFVKNLSFSLTTLP